MIKKKTRSKWRSAAIGVLLIMGTIVPQRSARADFWGGDLPLLMEIVVNTLQQISQLKMILSQGKDTLGYMQDINSGIRDAMQILQTMNSTLKPGVLSELGSLSEVLNAVGQIYGRIPRSPDARVQETTDQSIAESIHLHNEAFRYADRIDPEAERIKDYARVVSPQGAERLTAQSMGVLITVMNQVLRTNAALLKVQSEQLALMNRKEKIGSQQFKTQYEGLSKAFTDLNHNSYALPSLSP